MAGAGMNLEYHPVPPPCHVPVQSSGVPGAGRSRSPARQGRDRSAHSRWLVWLLASPCRRAESGGRGPGQKHRQRRSLERRERPGRSLERKQRREPGAMGGKPGCIPAGTARSLHGTGSIPACTAREAAAHEPGQPSPRDISPGHASSIPAPPLAPSRG